MSRVDPHARNRPPASGAARAAGPRSGVSAPRAPLPAAFLAGVPLLGIGACAPEAEPLRAPARPPNVVLISLDTLRADHLSCYGYRRETSPAIDALAERGVLFERAWSTTSWTLPAHLSMLTGLSISAHGVCDDRLWQAVGREDGLAEVPLRGAFLPELLKPAGYRTAGFVTWKYLERRFGFGPGFDVYERVGHSVFSHPELSKRFQSLREEGDHDAIRAWMEEEPELFDEQRPTAGEAVDRALAWLEERLAAGDGGPEAPLFLFLHLFDAHDDYVPPPPFDRRFDAGYDGPIDGRRVTSPDSPVHAGMAERDLEHLIALYDGEIAWVDSQVARVLDFLAESGLERDTLVVLTSDHGEEFFEHGAKTHRSQLYRESLNVPLVLSWPGVLPSGARVSDPAGIVDLVPTILGLAGIAPPARLSGRDLRGAALGEPPGEPAEYLSELALFPEGWSPILLASLQRGDRHVIRRETRDGEVEVLAFDLASDPEEREPERLEGEPLAAFEARLDRVRARTRAERDAAPPAGADSAPLSPEELRELERMGYVTGTGGEPAATGPPERLCLDGCVWP